MAALAMFGMAGCDHYNCNNAPQLSGSCTTSGSGLGTTGTGTGSGTASAFAFAVDEAGTIDGYTLNASTNTFQATTGYTAPAVPTNELGYGMVVAQTQFLYTAFIGTGQIYGWTIGSGGGLTAISNSPFSAPYLIGIGSNQGPEDMIVNPAGTLLFVDDVSVEGIYVYSIGSGGVLTAVSGSPFSVPFFPGNMAIDGQGKYLYVTTNTNGSQIAAYSIGTGALTPVLGSPFSYPMLQVEGEPTGTYLIGTTSSNVGDDHLYLFSITQSGSNAGAITQVQAVPTVYSPYSIAVQPNSGGNLIYSFSTNADDTGFNPIEGYQLSNGALTAVSGSPFSNVADGSWAQFDQSGAFLFPYSEVYDSSTGATTVQLGADDVASGGALTQPISPATLTTPGFWAVTDVP
jgi:hypothetical protein